MTFVRKECEWLAVSCIELSDVIYGAHAYNNSVF